MLLAAERLACLPEMLIIVSGMSIQDPREQPESQS
jgi:ATP-dependent helicase HrpA